MMMAPGRNTNFATKSVEFVSYQGNH